MLLDQLDLHKKQRNASNIEMLIVSVRRQTFLFDDQLQLHIWQTKKLVSHLLHGNILTYFMCGLQKSKRGNRNPGDTIQSGSDIGALMDMIFFNLSQLVAQLAHAPCRAIS